MIVDFNDFENGHIFEADVCVIGGGAAGITIAREFLSGQHSVVILEGGGKSQEPESQQLYNSEIAGLPHRGIHAGRARVWGGTTTLWAGQTLPLDEIDFQRRPWVPQSGWPIAKDDLEPYYRRAENVLQVKQIAYDASEWPYPGVKLIPFDRNLLQPLVSQFSPKPNFASAYEDQISNTPRIQLVLHANATALRASASGGSIDRVEIRSLRGRNGWTKARYYVICCGGIETPRLLLASDDVQRKGLGNQTDLVGRYFQDHIQAAIVPIQTNRLRALKASLLPFRWRGISYSPKSRLSPAVQQSREVLNATVGLTFNEFASQDSSVEAAKRVMRAVRNWQWDFPVWKTVARAAAKPHHVAMAGFRYSVLRRPAFEMTGTPYVGIQCECDPNPSSRVALSDERDTLGSRRARLEWRISARVRQTALVATEIFARELARLQLGRVEFESLCTSTEWEHSFFDSNHHIGTTRMADNPKEGVVNRNCGLHSVANLFVASSAVFPTGGHSNPTFTILALAIRLADHLKTLLAKNGR